MIQSTFSLFPFLNNQPHMDVYGKQYFDIFKSCNLFTRHLGGRRRSRTGPCPVLVLFENRTEMLLLVLMCDLKWSALFRSFNSILVTSFRNTQ